MKGEVVLTNKSLLCFKLTLALQPQYSYSAQPAAVFSVEEQVLRPPDLNPHICKMCQSNWTSPWISKYSVHVKVTVFWCEKLAEIVVLCYETGNPRDEPSWRGRTMNSLWAVFHHLLCQTVYVYSQRKNIFELLKHLRRQSTNSRMDYKNTYFITLFTMYRIYRSPYRRTKTNKLV